MELDSMTHALSNWRGSSAEQFVMHHLRWHSTDGRGRRGLGAVLSSLFLAQQAQALVHKQRVVPYVSLALAGICWALFFLHDVLELLLPTWLSAALSPSNAGLQPIAVLASPLTQGQRLVTAALLHDSNWHVYYNIVSLFHKGHAAERRFGSAYSVVLFLALQVTAAMLHVLISAVTGMEYFSTAIGLSSLLFALKALLHADPLASLERAEFFGFTLIGHWVSWLEIGLVALLFPHASLVGHVSGLLAGWAFHFLVNPYRVHFGDSLAGKALAQANCVFAYLQPARWVARANTYGAGQSGWAHQVSPPPPQQQQAQQGDAASSQRSPFSPPALAAAPASVPAAAAADLPSCSGGSMASNLTHFHGAVLDASSAAAIAALDALDVDASAGVASEQARALKLHALRMAERMLTNVQEQPAADKFRRVNRAKIRAKLYDTVASPATGAKTGVASAAAASSSASALPSDPLAFAASFAEERVAALLQSLGFVMQAPAVAGAELDVSSSPEVMVCPVLDASQLGQVGFVVYRLHGLLSAMEAAAEAARLREQFFEEQMEQMMRMGHRDRRLNFQALKATQGDVAQAVRKLAQLSYAQKRR